MSFIPDELWSKILEIGVATARLSCRDLCCLAITCRRLKFLSSEPRLWSILLSLDFPLPSSTSSMPSKSVYMTRFEKVKAQRLAEWRRSVLIAEGQEAICKNRLEELECQLRKESERMKAALDELGDLERVRRASVALNVWQPEIVRRSQSQMVEQCTVPIDFRLHNLKMEVNLCKQKIAAFKKAYNDQKKKLKECKEALLSMKYDPLKTFHIDISKNNLGTRG